MVSETPSEIVSDPAVMSGEPFVSGTGIPAHSILAYLRENEPPEEIRKGYPSLPKDGIEAVIRWAKASYGEDWKSAALPRFSLRDYQLQRDPDETDGEYAFRRSLF
ncbi:uncharacterized protein (DUF433 family) [Nitrobacteraceae bacterium AZCC 2161]